MYHVKPLLGAPLNIHHPLAKGLVGCWLFNEARGNKATELVNKVVSDTWSGATWAYNRLKLDNVSSQYISFLSQPLWDFAGDFSVECRFIARSTDTFQGYFTKQDSTNGFGIVDGESKIAFIVFSSGSYTYTYADNVVSDNTLYHVIGVRRDGTNYLYINNVKQADSDACSYTANPSAKVAFGRFYYDVDNYYAGADIEFARLFNRALTKDEIRKLYIDPFCMFDQIKVIKYYYFLSEGISWTADIQGVSTTPGIDTAISRALLADIQGQSTTSDILANLTRALTSNITAISTTANIKAILIRYLLANILANSTTQDITTTTARALLADIQGISTTSDILSITERSFIADIQGASTTNDITVALIRYFLTNIVGTSTTSDITATIEGIISWIANIQGTSTTPGIGATVKRKLQVDIAGSSATTNITAAVIRKLIANIAGVSTTADITAKLIIFWITSVTGISTTSEINKKIARFLLAAIDGQSSTSNLTAKIARTLLADIKGVSVTPDDLILILSAILAVIDPAIESLTPAKTIKSITPVKTIENT